MGSKNVNTKGIKYLISNKESFKNFHFYMICSLFPLVHNGSKEFNCDNKYSLYIMMEGLSEN